VWLRNVRIKDVHEITILNALLHGIPLNTDSVPLLTTVCKFQCTGYEVPLTDVFFYTPHFQSKFDASCLPQHLPPYRVRKLKVLRTGLTGFF
jgi:hypothetical protein